MVTDPYQGDTDLTASGDDLAARAVVLAQRWITESAEVDVDPAAERLAGVLKDPNGLPFTIGFVDGVMRPESLTAAASNLSRVAPLVPGFLPVVPARRRQGRRRGGARSCRRPSCRSRGGCCARWSGTSSSTRGPTSSARRSRRSARAARSSTSTCSARPCSARTRRCGGSRASTTLIRRPDVDYVSVKVSAIASHISMWAFDEVVDKVVERLMPLYLTAATDRTFINLDMEEYRDLDLTIAVFTRILEDPRLRDLEAGIVLQAYLPDALPALQQLTAWAQQRVAAGGARIKVRLVKGANLAMERVDAVMHGWPLATYDAKVDSDANYVRCLDFALRPENTAAVRIGVAGHNLFDIAYAWLLAGETGVRDDVEFEMLLGHGAGPGRGDRPRGRTRAPLRAGGASRRVRRRDQLPGAPARRERVERQLPLGGVRSRGRPGDVRARARPVPRIARARRRPRASDRTEPHAGPHGRAARIAAHPGARCIAAPDRRRGRRADAGGASASPDRRPPTPTTRRRSHPRPRRSSSSAASRSSRPPSTPRASPAHVPPGAPGFRNARRHRPGASGEPGVGARDPRPHRDLDRR